VAGGYESSTQKNNVLYSHIASDGTLESPACSGGTLNAPWCTSGNTFTTARQDNNLVAYNSVLYVVEGYDGTNNLGDIQSSAISVSDGGLATFGYTTNQDYKGRARSAAAANGYIYFFGTENSLTDSYYAAINVNNTLGNLYKASNLGMLAASNHVHGAVVFNDGFFYSLGGCTLTGASCSSTVNNNVEYAGQKASARLAHYTKLFDTQVDTAPSQLLINGTLSSGGSAVQTSLQTASTSDPVLGVAQVFKPTLLGNNYLIQALNSGGTNVGIAFNYFISLTLDDSQSGTFPENSTTTNVTDITIFYHANPGRRLRHGASFTNTGCNTVVANGCILDTAP